MHTVDELRRFTVARNFPIHTSLRRALQNIGFVQADPIRAPARAQDLIMRHRVKDYKVGDLERHYPELDIEEDFFINYGYVTKSLQQLMHPRQESRIQADDIGREWPMAQRKQAKLLLEFVRDRGVVHPRQVDEYFSHGKVTNYWGGSSNATTHLLDAMHYSGMLRIVRREKGIRIYAPQQHSNPAKSGNERRDRIDALVNTLVHIYAPLPSSSLSYYLRRLRYAAPQWKTEFTKAVARAKERLQTARIAGVEWYWAGDETGREQNSTEVVRLLAPFDPLVHDRRRFELLWGWIYRFEAYTPVAKRKLGYYAMPLLWRDQVIGWANLAVTNQDLNVDLGYVESQPRDRAYKRELELELERVRLFLKLGAQQ